jgi:drug/metabolite transporter (DMT)-like permease
MVCDSARPGADVRNRGITRGRMFMGGLLLFAAVILWGISLMMSPHSSATVAEGTEHVRGTVVTFVRNNAIGTLVLSGLAGWLLFPARRPNAPKRDYAILALLTVLIASSVYQLAWLQIAVLH